MSLTTLDLIIHFLHHIVITNFDIYDQRAKGLFMLLLMNYEIGPRPNALATPVAGLIVSMQKKSND